MTESDKLIELNEAKHLLKLVSAASTKLMDNHLQQKTRLQPSERASFLSKIFFCWSLPLFYKRYKNEVTENESFAPLKSHDASCLGGKLEKEWLQEVKTVPNPSLWRSIWQTFRFEFITLFLIFVISELAKISQPWLIGNLMVEYNKSNTDKNVIYLYNFLILFTSFLNVMIYHNYQFRIQHLGMKVRIACCSLIYRKILRANKTSLAETTTGKLVTLMSNDVNRLDLAGLYLSYLFLAPFETIIIIVCLYITAGATSLTGIVFSLFFVILQMYIGKLTLKFRKKTAVKTDLRTKLMNEIISGIQVIKMYTWEKSFSQLVQEARKLEIREVLKNAYLKSFNASAMLFMNRIGIGLCVLTFAIVQNKIDAKYVFLVSSCYAIIRQTLTVYFAFGLSNVSEAKVAIERIRKFLLTSELPKKELIIPVENDTENTPLITRFISNTGKNKVPGIRLENASVKWDQASPSYTLDSINFEAGSSELVAIVGPVGGGKSTLLYTILNELPLLQGQLEVGGTISYCSQEPWLFTGSIRQNILFGSEFEPKKYEKTVKVCRLEEDLLGFRFGDESIVGERGVLLSGGQKTRINLARAVYKEADIYLLDDPFSAVDARVGKEIFKQCITEHLKCKCVILITHHLQYLGSANKVYRMENGILTPLKAEQEYAIPNENTFNDFSCVTEPKTVSKENPEEKPKEIQEERKSGSISMQVYKRYIKAGGSYYVVFLLSLLFILAQVFASGADYFLAFWVNLEHANQREIFTHQLCIQIYSGILAFTILVPMIRSVISFKFCLQASKELHNQMLARIVSAPMSFFNINPSGRILNRFTKDMGLVDEVLPSLMMITFQITFIVVGSLILVSFLNLWLLIPSAIILIILYFFRIAFLATSRNLQRLEATKRSPLYSHINKSLEGLTTIRSCNAQHILKNEFDNYQNLHSSAFYMFITCSRAFGFWMDMICVWYTLAVIITITLMDTSVGNVGLGITQSINLVGLFQFGIRQWSELENQMITVERLVDYTEIKPEKTEGEEPPPEWPSEGRIEFESVSLQYSMRGPQVLREVSFVVKPNEKIGIVGRTGAGKSSLISAFLRLFAFEGNIAVDGVNVREISLHSLRSKVSIIPQEPKLFSGSLRRNLDPYDEFDDEKLWKVLEKVELKNAISKLSDEIVESGSNFSTGQRQLICLARAILKNNKILFLDEATANVDPETDDLIQKTIRENFDNCTVITVAHRLHTVLDLDKVLVMDGGEVVEFDGIDALLQNANSMFYQLVRESGSIMNERLPNGTDQDIFFKNCDKNN